MRRISATVCILMIFAGNSSLSAQVTRHSEQSLFGSWYLMNGKGEKRYFDFAGRLPSVGHWFESNPVALREYQEFEKYSNRAFWSYITGVVGGVALLSTGMVLSGGGHAGSSNSTSGALAAGGLLTLLVSLPVVFYFKNTSESHLDSAINTLNGFNTVPNQSPGAFQKDRTDYVSILYRF